jgi:uncharacterized SAM-dependent methyltransferase
MSSGASFQAPPQAVKLYDFHPPMEDFRSAVLQGLTQAQKALPPHFLYDKRGSELFDAICHLPEYYLTRTEIAILSTHTNDIARALDHRVLVELGSGSSQKIRVLLQAAPQMQTYVGVDISRQHLQESCLALMQDFDGLQTIALSIGNLEPTEAVTFLKTVAVLGELIVGVDLKKSADILEPAYDDAQGVSAAFALNLLTRINRELGANFDLSQFTYQAHYNETAGRIEMGIVSQRSQSVHLGDTVISFAQGEILRTEHSYKYTVEEFQLLAMDAGFQPIEVWVDPDQYFSLHHLKCLQAN